MTLGKDYAKFKTKITECMDILARNDSLDTFEKENSVLNLVSSGLVAVMDLVEKQNQVFSKLLPIVEFREREGAELQADYDLKVQERDTAIDQLAITNTRTKAIIKEVCYAMQLQQSISQGDDLTGRKLICQFYNYKDTATYHNSKVKDNDLKSIKVFTGREADVDWSCETLLTNLSTTAAQLELGERGLCLALLSKLSDIGLQIIKGRMDSLNLTPETIEFSQLQALVEESFMKNSDSKSALRALYSLKPLQQGNTAYQQLEGQILRLCRLSLQHVNDPKEKQILFHSRSREVFLRCLTPEDRQKISLKEIERSQKSESPWQLHQIVSYLTDVSKISQELNASAAVQYQDSTIRQAQEENTDNYDNDEEEFENVNFIRGRGNTRFRGRFLRSRGRSSAQFAGQNRGNMRGRGASSRPFHNNSSNRAPNARRGFQNPARGGNRGRMANISAMLRQLNLPPRSCIMCAQPLDGNGCSGPSSPRCPYRDVPQMPSNCYNFKPQLLQNYNKTTSDRSLCCGGKHSASSCVGLILNALNHRRRWLTEKQQGAANFVADDNEDFDASAFLEQLENDE